MSHLSVGAAWKLRAIAALSVAAVTGMGTLGCKKSNAAFCEDIDDCESGQVCSDNACEASNLDAAVPRPDASPACPAETHQCLQSAPAGWSGPTARADISEGLEAPSCADSAQNGLLAGSGFDTTASCACECTTTFEVACTAAKMEAREDTGLDCRIGSCLNCPLQIVPSGVCSTLSTDVVPGANGVVSTRMYPGTLISGSCIGGVNTENFSALEFEEQIGLCDLASEPAGCSEGSLCAPLPADGFLEESCVFQSGEHECPADTNYVDRHLTFSGLTDNRSCATCSCGLPAAGTSCGGAIHQCNSGALTNSQGVGCASVGDWANILGYEYTPNPADVDCVPAEENPAVNGEITGADPITVCCTATE